LLVAALIELGQSQDFLPPSNILDRSKALLRLSQLTEIELARGNPAGIEMRKNELSLFASRGDYCLLLTVFSYKTDLPGMYMVEVIVIQPRSDGATSRRTALCSMPASVADPLLEFARTLLGRVGYTNGPAIYSGTEEDEFELSVGMMNGEIRSPVAKSPPGVFVHACLSLVEATLTPFGDAQDKAFAKVAIQLKAALSKNAPLDESKSSTEGQTSIDLKAHIKLWKTEEESIK
jgi:hypothetical protein